MMTSIDDAYHDVLAPVLRKHKRTLAQIDGLLKRGRTDDASMVWRRSGLLDDLAKAIADAGATSADAIRKGLKQTREVEANES